MRRRKGELNMKGNNTKGYFVLGVSFALVSMIAFATPTVKTAAFWIAYAFTAAAFAAQIPIWKTALGRDDELESKFLGFPVVHIGIAYLIVQLMAFSVFLFVPTAPAWVSVVACAAIAKVSAVCMVSTETGRGEIERVEAKTQEKVFLIRRLQASVELLAEQETDPATKEALAQLAEKIRFSDPISHNQLAEVERKIADKVEKLATARDKTRTIEETSLLLDERNKRAKLLK